MLCSCLARGPMQDYKEESRHVTKGFFMTLAELQQALRTVEPAAVLVSPRVLETIIRQASTSTGMTWQVPHRKSFIVDRQTLFRHVDQEELALGPDQLLPPTVMLLAWPEEADRTHRGSRHQGNPP